MDSGSHSLRSYIVLLSLVVATAISVGYIAILFQKSAPQQVRSDFDPNEALTRVTNDLPSIAMVNLEDRSLIMDSTLLKAESLFPSFDEFSPSELKLVNSWMDKCRFDETST